jgi:hypothetical protein
MSKFDLFKEGDQHASVGFVRGDGDFEILATFNNSGGFTTEKCFFKRVTSFVDTLNSGSLDEVIALAREDAPDIVVFDKE